MEQARPPSRSKDWHALLSAAVVFVLASSITTVLRYIARKRQTVRTGMKEGLWWDDVLIFCAAIIAFFASLGVIIVAVYLTSAPRHKVPKEFPCWTFFATHLSWILVHWLATLSILALYSRHFGDTRRIKYLINWLRVIVTLWFIGATLWTVLGEGLPPIRYCTNGPNGRYIARIITTSVVHFAIDIAILIIPILLVKMMQRKLSHKCFLILMYSLGVITLSFSAIRLYYLIKRLHEPDPEILHYSVMSVMWSIIEIHTSVTVVNLPTLMPIVDWCLEKKKKVKDYLDKATREDIAINGMILLRNKPRMSMSPYDDDPENPQADNEDTCEPESQARRPSETAAELGGQPSSFETTSLGSLREREHNTPFRVTN